jgi:VWFA-related protein
VRSLLAVLLTFAVAVELLAQNAPAARTERPESSYVRIDLFASQDGRPIDNLNRDEIELLEDGVAQTIDSFEHVQIGSGSPSASRARVFVVFLDTYHTQIEGSSSLRLPLIRFLDRLIGSDDVVAVMTPEMGAGEMVFGRKGVVISNIMQSDWAWARRGRADSRDPKEELYDACYPDSPKGPQGPAGDMKARRREKLTLAALDDLVSHLDGMRDERKAILTVSDGWMLFKPDRTLLSSGKGKADDGSLDRLLRRPPQKGDEPARGGVKDVNYVECQADRESLSTLDDSMALRSLAEDANRANITFYSVYPRGLLSSPTVTTSQSSGKGRESNLATRQDSLRFLADNTDGVSIMSASSVDASMARIIDDVSSYYLVGYVSSNMRLDGRFRTITARVKREGAKVRTRRGYRGRTADELTSSKGPTLRNTTEGLSAKDAANARSPFRIRASSWVRPAAGGDTKASFWIVGELDYQTRRQLAWTAGAFADVVVLASDGTEVLSRTFDIKASDGPLAVQVPESGGVPVGEYAVRVQLRSQADTEVALTDTARVEVKEGVALGEAVLWRRGPTTGPQYLRTADPRFQRSDRLRLELATTSTTAATARLLDRNGNQLQAPVQVSERADPSSTFRWVVVDALLAPFANGDYAVEVVQGDSKQVTPFRVVP